MPDATLAQGKILKRCIDAGKTARKRFMETGREIARYAYAKDHDFDYQKIPGKISFKAKVGKTGEAVAIFGPALYQRNPHRLVTSRPWANERTQARNRVMQDYLNYTPNETDHFTHARRAVDEAIIYGRGVLWTGLHPRTGLVCSQYDSVRNLVVDPDAVIWEDVRWIARRRDRPRDELIAELERYPDAAQAIEMVKKLPEATKRPSDGDSATEWDKRDFGGDMVCYWEFYSIVPLNVFKGGKGVPPDENAGPRKYLVTDDGKYLHACDWEIPFYEFDSWPMSPLDFYANPDSIWSVSPLEPGLGYQRAINWTVSTMIGKYRFTNRTLMAHLKQNGQGLSQANKDKVMSAFANDFDMLEIEVKGEVRKLSEFLETFTFSQDYVQAGVQMLNLLESYFEKATGLYSFLYSGEGERQSRSAMEAQVKDRNSRSRVEDMRESVARWESMVARKEAFAARFLLQPQDIADLLGPEAGQAWGTLIPDGADPQQMMMEMMQQGLPPEAAMEQISMLMANAVTIKSWMRETDFSIESGSQRRRDIDAQIDALKETMNQVNSALLQSPDLTQQSMAFANMAAYYELIGLSPELVALFKNQQAQLMQMGQQMRMNPPPPPEAAQPKK
jgi:hypothetical protein